jgi:hypothetical protein
MIEVFKTNITDECKATQVCEAIAHEFPEYAINFDLQDCDHVMRIQSREIVDCIAIVRLIQACGFEAKVLSDEIPLIIMETEVGWQNLSL